jgi:hypothetical protein
MIDELVAAGEADKPFDAKECPFVAALSDMVKKVRSPAVGGGVWGACVLASAQASAWVGGCLSDCSKSRAQVCVIQQVFCVSTAHVKWVPVRARLVCSSCSAMVDDPHVRRRG